MTINFGNLAFTTLIFSASLILAVLGGYTSERSGIINIALEGKMLMSCCVTALVGIATHNAFLSICAGMASSVVLSVLHWLFTQQYRMDPIISGMGINAIALGSTNYLSQRLITPGVDDKIPIFPVPVYLGLALLLPFLVALYVARTRGGLWMLAVGSDPNKSRLAGLKPAKIRLLALVATGLFTGLSGVLIVTNSGRYVDGMTSGRGFIALAALILGGWRPIPAAIACVIFAFFDALQLQFQGQNIFGSSIPAEYWSCLPYVATVIALAGLAGKNRAPQGLGKI